MDYQHFPLIIFGLLTLIHYNGYSIDAETLKSVVVTGKPIIIKGNAIGHCKSERVAGHMYPVNCKQYNKSECAKKAGQLDCSKFNKQHKKNCDKLKNSKTNKVNYLDFCVGSKRTKTSAKKLIVKRKSNNLLIFKQ